jgi:isocitrate dehydrogenase kinase/phosphatase
MLMFREAGVKVTYFESDIVIPEIYMNAKMYDAAVYLNKSGDQ